MNDEKVRKKEAAAIIVAALLVTVGLIGSSYILTQEENQMTIDVGGVNSTPSIYVSSIPPEHSIHVSGKATERTAPDLLVIQFKVQTESTNAKQSQERNAELMEQVMERLEEKGIADESIETAYYRVEPVRKNERVCDEDGCHYNYETKGYKTVHMLNVKVEDLDRGGEIIDSVTEVGINETFVEYLDFTLKDETREAIEESLLSSASEKAHEKAENIAEGLSVSLGKAISASESMYYPYRGYSQRMDSSMVSYAMAESSTTPLSGGEIEVTATVNAEFEIS